MDLIIKPTKSTNYRIKICVNFIVNNKLIDSYNDQITDGTLLNSINNFITILKEANANNDIMYGQFQKSNNSDKYGLIIYVKKDYSTQQINKIYQKLEQDKDLCVFGYSIVNSNKNTVKYLTEGTRITNKYYDFYWLVSITGFIQAHPDISNIIHRIVDEWIKKDTKYFGLGGETAVYIKKNKNKCENICLTDSEAIYNDCVNNAGSDITCFHVDYKSVKLIDYVKNSEEYTLIVNIGRNGLTDLTKQIINMEFRQIIYVGCCDDAVMKDINNLSEKYEVKQRKILKQFPETEYFSYVIEFQYFDMKH